MSEFHPFFKGIDAFYELAKRMRVACCHVGVWHDDVVRYLKRIFRHLGKEQTPDAVEPVFFFVLAVAIDVCPFNPALPFAHVIFADVARLLHYGVANEREKVRARDGALFENCE